MYRINILICFFNYTFYTIFLNLFYFLNPSSFFFNFFFSCTFISMYCFNCIVIREFIYFNLILIILFFTIVTYCPHVIRFPSRCPCSPHKSKSIVLCVRVNKKPYSFHEYFSVNKIEKKYNFFPRKEIEEEMGMVRIMKEG